jgi:hypothetical protein
MTNTTNAPVTFRKSYQSHYSSNGFVLKIASPLNHDTGRYEPEWQIFKVEGINDTLVNRVKTFAEAVEWVKAQPVVK